MPEHANVIEALAAISAELPAIAKVPHPSESGKGITYAYRGIEEITAHAQQLFAKHGVVVVPQVHHREVKDIIVNGNPWTDTFLEVYWSIYGSGGVEDVVQAATFGQGRDNSDKGTNKAMTQAFKYLLLDMLMISDPSDDNDGTNIEVDARTHTSYVAPAQEQYEMINGEQIPTGTEGIEVRRTGPGGADGTLIGNGTDSKRIYAMSKKLDQEADVNDVCYQITGRSIKHTSQLTRYEYDQVFAELKRRGA